MTISPRDERGRRGRLGSRSGSERIRSKTPLPKGATELWSAIQGVQRSRRGFAYHTPLSRKSLRRLSLAPLPYWTMAKGCKGLEADGSKFGESEEGECRGEGTATSGRSVKRRYVEVGRDLSSASALWPWAVSMPLSAHDKPQRRGAEMPWSCDIALGGCDPPEVLPLDRVIPDCRGVG